MFKPGQLVRCVKADGWLTGLVQGRVYEVGSLPSWVSAKYVAIDGKTCFARRFVAHEASEVGTFPFLAPGKGRV